MANQGVSRAYCWGIRRKVMKWLIVGAAFPLELMCESEGLTVEGANNAVAPHAGGVSPKALHQDDNYDAQAGGWESRLGRHEGDQTPSTSLQSRWGRWGVVTSSTSAAAFQTTPSTSLNPAQLDSIKCEDSMDTGIKFRRGAKASCEDLQNYCNHTGLRRKVVESCPQTCGLCKLDIDSGFVRNHRACKDLAPKAHPLLTMGNRVVECAEVKEFCENHEYSVFIKRKCPSSCLMCGGETSTTTTSTALEFMNQNITEDLDASNAFDKSLGLQCSRRRRFGFCSSRRRRDSTATDDSETSEASP